MNPRMSGKITKKYLGTPKHNSNGFPMRLDSVYVNGKKFTYFSNAPKDNPSIEAITDRYPDCHEGTAVDIEYTTSPKPDGTGEYFNIKGMEPSGSTLPASDPVAAITRRVPEHLKPGPVPEEPLPDLNAPVGLKDFKSGHPQPAPTVGDEQAWRIARSVAAKPIFDAAIAEGGTNALFMSWNPENRPATVGLINSIARYIVTGE